jgi:two-component system CheB/CheR fusion protein
MRRIERRKGIHQLDSTQDYVRFTGNPNEIQLLFKELLIGVTSFSVTQTYGKTKSVILLTLLKVYLTGMYFGHGLPPAQQEKRHTRLPSLSRRL